MSLDYLVKFNQLPAEVRTRVSSPAVMGEINRLEEAYQIRLASLIMRLLVEEIKAEELESYLLTEAKLAPDAAISLAGELKKLLSSLAAVPAAATEVEAPQEPVPAPTPEPVPAAPAEALPPPTVVAAPAVDHSPVARGRELAVEGNLLPGQAHPEPSQAETEVRELSAEFKELAREKVLKLDLAAGGQDVIFSSEDAAEIKALSEQIENKKTDDTEKALAEQANNLLREAKISFSSQILVDRFKQILTTHLRGIRSKIDTRDAMVKPIEAGGLGLEAGEADMVLDLALKYPVMAEAARVEPPKKIVLPEDKLAADRLAVLKEIGARDVEYDLSKALAERQAKEAAAASANPSAAAAAPVTQPSAPAVSATAVPAAAPAQAKRSFLFFRNNDAGGRPKLQDVKAVPRTMGPLEELQYMDAISFRRLSPLPEEAIAKIKNKVSLLEKEQYSKRLEGIKAWRKSPLNQLYLGMAQAALEQRISMAELIAKRQADHEDYLNQGEFEAIMKLNQELRF